MSGGPSEHTLFARSIALSGMQKLSERGCDSRDICAIFAVAVAEVHCLLYGIGGLEELRNAIDVMERQILDGSVEVQDRPTSH